MDQERTWLLMAKKFSGEVTPDELKELEKLFESDHDLQDAYFLIGNLKGSDENDEGMLQSGLKRIETAMQEDMPTIQKNSRISFKQHKIWLVAASLALMIAAASGIFIYNKKNLTSRQEVAFTRDTARVYVATQASSIVLQDGTKVWLNSGSKLRCSNRFNIQKREVNLIGEAFFNVAQDASRPFIVHAGKLLNVKVLGTSFNVKAYPQDPFVEASLISGKIAIDINNKIGRQVILKPHEKLTVYTRSAAADSLTTTIRQQPVLNYQVKPIKLNPIDNAVSELSWMKDKLAFNDMPFEELAFDLERIYHVRISFENKNLKEYHLTGVFKDENLNEVLHALQVTTPFQYKISQNTVKIYQ